MQVRKQQLELDMEQQTGSKYEKDSIIGQVLKLHFDLLTDAS